MKRLVDWTENLSLIRKIIVLVGIIIAMSIMGYLLLVLVYCIPTNKMNNKTMYESAYYMSREGGAFSVTNRENGMLDGSTDGLMLLEAAYRNKYSPWIEACRTAHNSVSGGNPAQQLTLMYMSGDNIEVIDEEYARYWHGYLIFLKPLLLFFNYGHIRSLLAFVQLGLFTLLVYLLSQKKKTLVLPVFLFWLSINPIATMMSMQYSTVLIVTLVALIVITIKSDMIKRDSFLWSIIFTIIGGLTSYFDYLTYPIVALGASLVLWFSLLGCEKIIKDIAIIVKLSLSWCLGYAGLWALKWLIGSVITGKNVILEGVNQVATRSSNTNGDVSINYFELIKQQLVGSYQVSIVIVLILLSIIFVAYLFKIRKVRINEAVIYSLIMLYPFVWYFVTQNHAYLHPYITCRNISLTIFSFSSYISNEILDNKQ